MKLSITTDFETSAGDPSATLKLIADAGFSHVNWCHHRDDDPAVLDEMVSAHREGVTS